MKFIGNSRIAQCSHLLKQKIAKDWILKYFKPDECILYLGIDWTEDHRKDAPIENYKPYKVEFPMCEEPYLSKDEMIDFLKEINIEIPKLYKLGYSHNNCGGFCVRAGQGHFAHLLKTNPNLYKYHEEKEEEMREYLKKDVSILTRTKTKSVYVEGYSSEKWIDWSKEKIKRDESYLDAVKRLTTNGYRNIPVKSTLTLKMLREEIEGNQTGEIDFDDIGGCGCFVTN